MSDIVSQRKEQLARYGVISDFYDLQNMLDSEFSRVLELSRLSFEGKPIKSDKQKIIELTIKLNTFDLPSCDTIEAQLIVKYVRRDLDDILIYLNEFSKSFIYL